MSTVVDLQLIIVVYRIVGNILSGNCHRKYTINASRCHTVKLYCA